MVEIFEKCFVIGIGFMLALSFYPPMLNIISQLYNSVSENQLNLLAKEIRKAIEKVYLCKGEYDFSCIVPKDFSLSFEDKVLKVYCNGKIVNLGIYNFNIIIDDKREGSGCVKIVFIGKEDTVFIVIEDAN